MPVRHVPCFVCCIACARELAMNAAKKKAATLAHLSWNYLPLIA